MAIDPARPTCAQEPGKPTYVSALKTRALMAGSLSWRAQRHRAKDMVPAAVAAGLAGVSTAQLSQWFARGQVIGLEHSRRVTRFPAWQFEPALWAVLREVAGTRGSCDGWALLAFLETPCGALNGMTPRQAVEQGLATRVVALAAAVV